MTENERKYLTALGDAFLVAGHMQRQSTPEEMYAALLAGVNDDYHSVGTMAGLRRAEMVEVVDALVAGRHIRVGPGRVAVALLPAGETWYLTTMLGIEPLKGS